MRIFSASSPCLLSPISFASCLRRALLTGLTSNPHINDLHLDISGCEVRLSTTLGVGSELKFTQLNPILSYGLGEKCESFKSLMYVGHCEAVKDKFKLERNVTMKR